MTIQVSGSCISFSDGSVQSTGAKSPYPTGVACSAISAGDPVSLVCGCNGLATTAGLGSPTTYLYAQQCSWCCSCYCCGGGGGAGQYWSAGTAATSDTSLMKFSDSCFVSIETVTCCSSGYCAFGGFSCLRAHTIQAGGNIITTCICSLSIGTNCVAGRSWVIPGCSGTTGAFLTPMSPCGTCLMETFLCYCTTTQTISLIRQCFGTTSYKTYTSFVTPDHLYYVSFVIQSSPYGCYFGSCGQCPISTCSSWCVAAIVKQTTDSVCYLCTNLATSCTSLLNSVLPATCATWHAGGSFDIACCYYCVVNICVNCPGSYCCAYCAQETMACCAGFQGGIAAARGFTPFTYGQDGWILMNFYVCGTTTGTPCLGMCCVCAMCWTDKYFGFKPIGMDCYAITCNSIVPDRTGSTNTLLYYANRFCKSSIIGTNADFGFMYDAGDCIKRQYITSNLPQIFRYSFSCYCWNAACCTSCSLGSCCCSCAISGACTGVIQCFCVGAGPCIYFLGVTCCAGNPDSGYIGTTGVMCFCSQYCQRPDYIHCFYPIGGTPMTTKTYGSQPDVAESPAWFYTCYQGCSCYITCCCAGCYLAPVYCYCPNIVSAFGAKRSAYISAAYLATTPICIATGCYAMSMDPGELFGCRTECGGAIPGGMGSIVNNWMPTTFWQNDAQQTTPPCTQCCVGLGFCAGQYNAYTGFIYKFNPSGFAGDMCTNFSITCQVTNQQGCAACAAYSLNCPSSYGYGLACSCPIIGGYTPNTILTKNNNIFVAFSNYSGYYNCALCAYCGVLYNQPVILSSYFGQYFCYGINYFILCCYIYSCPGCGCCNSGITKNALGVSTVTPTVPNLTQFIGIAQNSASAGQNVCYAVPGTIDRSPFAQCVACNYGGSVLTTVGWSNQWCTANCCCSTWVTCPANNVLIGGSLANCCTCVYMFTNYHDNISFVPTYDASLGQWTTQILPHCRNALAPANCSNYQCFT